ncbi:GNAT family N-acetyltransferase [Rhodoblastus sp.]|uniref:GNAT family N-acetyltransferase n=1 Tax=Rhodoblastus sp. TaxID=1962975 RepID=UPI003F9887D6
MTQIAPEPKFFRIAREAGADAGAQTAARLAEDVAATFGPRDESPFALAAHESSGGWIGGIRGVIHWRWLYVAQLFVAPGWRGQGLGRALLAEAESLAREKNCVGIYLDTFSPNAEGFYRAQGFAVAGRIENFPPGAARTFLSKPL